MKKVIAFGGTKIGKHKFQYHKNLVLLDGVDIYKIILSNKVCFGEESFKYLIGYKNNDKVKPLCIMLAYIASEIKMYKQKVLMKLNIWFFYKRYKAKT